MRNHTDTRLVSDFNLLSPVSWRRWPRPEVIDAGAVLFHEGSAATEVFWIVDGLIKLVGRHPGVCERTPSDREQVEPEQLDLEHVDPGRSDPGRSDFRQSDRSHADSQAHAVTLGLRRGRSLLGPFIASHPAEHAISAIAVAPTRLYRFAATDFRERLADPAFMESARPAMSHALQEDLEDYTRGFLRDPEQRLATLLSTFVQETVATGECVQVALPRGLDTRDLAALLRVTSAEMTDLLAGWGQRGFARREQEGFTFCWTSLKGAVRRGAASSSAAAPRVKARPAPFAQASASEASDSAQSTSASSASPRQLPDARVIKALTLIDNGYSKEDFGLGDLGRELKLPAWHLSRLLKTATGMTFGQLRNTVRVERARVALLTTELSVKEIAAGVGYTHPTDLTRHFRAVHSLSPIAYRAQARQGADTGAAPPLRSAMPLIATAMRR
jgi:AraC-like DNA-binding protein/CRP-like cAMP-binding protein